MNAWAYRLRLPALAAALPVLTAVVGVALVTADWRLKYLAAAVGIGVALVSFSAEGLVTLAWLVSFLRPYNLGWPTRRDDLLVLAVVVLSLTAVRRSGVSTRGLRPLAIPLLLLAALLARTYLDNSSLIAPLWLINLLVFAVLLVASFAAARDARFYSSWFVTFAVSIGTIGFVWNHRGRLLSLWGSDLLDKDMPILGHLNVAAAILVGLLPIVWSTAPRTIRWPLCGLACIGIALTGSRSAWIGVVVLVALLIARSGRGRSSRTMRVVYVGSIAIIAAILVSSMHATPVSSLVRARYDQLGSSDLSGRIGIWDDSWRVARAHLVFGAGPGGFSADLALTARHPESLVLSSATGAKVHAHDAYLTIIAMFGLLLAIPIIVAVFRTARHPLRDPSGAVIGLVALLAYGVFEDLMTFPALSATLAIVIGFALRAECELRDSSDELARPTDAERPGDSATVRP